MSRYRRFNSVLFTCIFVSLLFTVLFSSLSSEVLAQETAEDDPEYFMGILILESQQQAILDSIKKVKDLQLGNMVILHPLDQAWNLTLIEEAIRTANNLGLYTIFETYDMSDHHVRISPEQFATWQSKYPRLLGILVQEITGKQIDGSTWADNSTGTIKTRLQAEQAVIENITSQMQLADFKNHGATILASGKRGQLRLSEHVLLRRFNHQGLQCSKHRTDDWINPRNGKHLQHTRMGAVGGHMERMDKASSLHLKRCGTCPV